MKRFVHTLDEREGTIIQERMHVHDDFWETLRQGSEAFKFERILSITNPESWTNDMKVRAKEFVRGLHIAWGGKLIWNGVLVWEDYEEVVNIVAKNTVRLVNSQEVGVDRLEKDFDFENG